MARGMVEIPLVEDGEPQPVPPRPDPATEWLRHAARGGLRAARRTLGLVVRGTRVPWVRWLAAGAAAALVVVPVADAARERTRLAALADVPGVVRPLHPGLTPLYRLEGEPAAVLQTGFELDGTVISTSAWDTTGAHAIALDPGTGQPRWSTPLAQDEWLPVCRPAGELVGCTESGGSASAAVWVLDPSDGAVLRTARYDEHSGAVVADGLVVVAQQVAGPARAPSSGPWTVTWRVVGEDPRTGEARWTWSSPPLEVVAEDQDDVTHDPDDYGASLWTADADGRDVALRVGDDTWLLGPEGAEKAHVSRPGGWVLSEQRGGAVARQPMVHAGHSEVPPMELLLGDGSWLPVDGHPQMFSVDDGSAPGLVLLVASTGGRRTLTGLEARSGRSVWQATLADDGENLFWGSAVLLDGRVYVGALDLVALDAATGEPLWTTPGAGGYLTTDGSVLLVQSHAAQGPGVNAYGLSDGRLRWSDDLHEVYPPGTSGNFGGLSFSLPVGRVGVYRIDGSLTVVG